MPTRSVAMKRRYRGTSIGLALPFFLLAACGVRTPPHQPPARRLVVAARLYDLRSSEVIQAQFVFNGTTYGQIDFTLPSGERFKGDYQTVSGAVSSWGAVYSLAWTSSGLAAARTNAALTVAPHEYSGSPWHQATAIESSSASTSPQTRRPRRTATVPAATTLDMRTS